MQGPYGGRGWDGQSLHPLLPLLVPSSHLDAFSASLLWGAESPFSVTSVPTSFFSPVCFLLPNLMCVSFLVVVFTSCLCLICESDSRDNLSGRAPKQRSRALQGEAGGVLGASRNCSLETAPGAFFPFITHIIVDFRNKDITLENQDSTKVILKFQISLTLLFKAKWISMFVCIPAFSCSRESLIPTSSLRERYSVPPYLHQTGEKGDFLPLLLN